MRARTLLLWLAVVLALPALTLTAARLTDPSGSVGIALVALTPVALPLYAGTLLLAVAAMLLRRRWRSSALPVALVAVAGLVVHGWWFAPQVSGAAPSPAADSESTVVMTANLFFGAADPAAVVADVRDGDVDLLVVNEVTETSVAGLDAAGLADLLPHRVGEPAPDGDGTATMAFSRTPIAEVSRISMLQAGWLFTTGGLVVAAVHAFAPNEPDLWRADHDALAAVVAAREPDLVVGDLNATVDHAPMRRLADVGYRDAGELADAGWQPTWPAMRVRRIPGIPLAQIDHVLVGPRLTALDQSAVDLPGSDHEGLVAEVAPR